MKDKLSLADIFQSANKDLFEKVFVVKRLQPEKI